LAASSEEEVCFHQFLKTLHIHSLQAARAAPEMGCSGDALDTCRFKTQSVRATQSLLW